MANALKFTDRGRVTLGLRIVDDETLVLEVEDTGVGFPQSKANRLFEPFQQLDGSGARVFEGSGLGLAISHRLTRSLGGVIEARGRPGEGARFTVRIPTKVPAHATPTDTARGERRAAGETPEAVTLSGRILVVDDNDDVRMLIAEYVRAAGGEVVQAASGPAALEILGSDEEVDVILMDVQMPHMDGLETVKILRGRGVNTPVIAVTARALESDRAECIAAGCTDYVPKPVDIPLLLQRIAHLLQGAPSVLIVDDNDDIASLTALNLEQSGFTCATASNGERALARAAEMKPEIVIADLSLGRGIDGFELAAKLRALDSRLMLIALSGASQKREQALEAGFDHFLTKPADFTELITLMTR
ncbi:MAG: hypothetical protein CMN30_10715 [Sandaracinus sp.]|nr:hypothetical protein [Sandaracinus sp.]|tara:strand:+ start:5300 stop:6382 length:1083 start_codon:yes stop_codon:yes gene_type:complete